MPGQTDGQAVAGGSRIGRLKGNIGDQQYVLHTGVGAEPATVVIWCRAFSVAFAAAQLRA